VPKMSTRFTDPGMLDKISFTGRIFRTKFTGRDFLTQFSFFLFCYTTKLPSTVETCELLLVSYNSQNKTAQPSNTNYKCTSSTELTSATCYAGLYMTCSSMHISCYHYPLPAGCWLWECGRSIEQSNPHGHICALLTIWPDSLPRSTFSP
jgi:hypothetical protein